MSNLHQPFHQKYRPRCLDELVGQEVISLTLKQALKSRRIAPAYLFSGPRGTGKTSSARIFAKSLNCLRHDEPNCNPCNNCSMCKSIADGMALDIIEIDAASNTGVDNIRELIERARFTPTQARWKVYVIDECHMLSTAASNALLKTIEEPPKDVVFILATTNPERVISTIQSRCQSFDFKRININEIYKHLIFISKKESIIYEDIALKIIAKRSNGGMRDAQSLLDQLSLIPDGVNRKNVDQLLGEVSENDLLNLLSSLIENDSSGIIKNCSDLYDNGNEPSQILEGLLNITRDLLLKTSNCRYSDLFYTSEDFYKELVKLSKLIDKSKIVEWHNKLKDIEYKIKNSNQPRLWLEIHLTSLLDIANHKIKTGPKIPQEEFKINRKIKAEPQIPKEELKIDSKINAFKSPINLESSEASLENNLKNRDDNQSIELKEKWSLILSKLELPSTRMLLSQQAELVGIGNENVEIFLSPNWENMIKSRKPIIENAVKKIFGEKMNVNFTSEKNITKISNKNDSKNNEIIKKDNQIINKVIREDISSKGELDQSTNSRGTENLANFFNGQIIDSQE